MQRLRVCFIWHMHQPIYRDPGTGEYILPWVRLHATRAYYDMARVLSEFEGARAVVNLVPSLLWQLDQYARGQAKDRFLELTRKRAADLTRREREFIVKNFFMLDWETNVRPLPRYWQLLHKRGCDPAKLDLASAAEQFSTAEMRDLQVLFNLGWMGFRAEEEEECVRALKTKGREFSEEDKAALLETQQRIVGKIIPAFAEVQRSGQAELTVTPFYHPILPLLVDSGSAQRAMPGAVLPPRFSYPEDAHVQVSRALDLAQSLLGARPQGMWPAEGSVSPEAVAVLAAEGVRWCATDEGILLRSKPPRTRSERTLYRPYRVHALDRQINMLFRDRGLSDLIGFTYGKATAENAVDDLFKHLTTIAGAAPQGEAPLVTIALDGENPWEHYPHSGRDFLRLLYRRLTERSGGIEPVAAGEYLAQFPPSDVIDELHTGSWIDSNFRIWIGHPEDNLGWTYLRDARRAVEEKAHQGAPPEKIQAAKDALYVAEGSDWFWWYGDEFTTDSAAEFDALFRGYVRKAWRELGEMPPRQLDEPIKRLGPPIASLRQEPQGFIHPRLDGRVRSYFDWNGAGLYQMDEAQGAMFHAGGLFDSLRFGFDEHSFFLRLDPASALGDLTQRATALHIQLVFGDRRLELEIPLAVGETEPMISGQRPEGGKALGQRVGRASVHEIIEIALPFDRLGLSASARIAFAVLALRAGIEVERLPRSGYISFAVPDKDYERKNWKA